jgi:heme/copper-type cytochrome/quinol oxidase subunit 1
MKILTGWTRVITVGFVLIALSGAMALTQKIGPAQMPGGATAGQDPFGQDASKSKLDSPLANTVNKQAEMRNDERQKRLVSDTEKLLTLATELHQDVGKTDKHILSVDVVKRAEEIEKLAHSVKERMKG